VCRCRRVIAVQWCWRYGQRTLKRATRAVLSRDVASGRRALAALVSRAYRRRHVSGRSYTRRLACNKVLEKEKNNSKVPTPPHTWRTPLLHLHSL
jgi:hypothetical protein